ncbi:hypothetical protein EIP91_002309 [Steccherinum ochraceum]|uniref:F-box domain-containing protein n=1 Tax=Steccherinum ochraceum TaxID=92696 RepID=A0A4R0RED8_9APHY|nr:hypothetical protein EIP91_002309 [Steccherinum ochraceum]
MEDNPELSISSCPCLVSYESFTSEGSDYINRIPDDVLIDILDHFIGDVHIDHGSPSSPIGRYSLWVPLMLVCRRWNQIIPNTPRLWSFVDWVSKPACVRAVLSRSGQHLISQMRLWLPEDAGRKLKSEDWNDMPSAMQAVLAELPRVRHLSLSFASWYPHDPVSTIKHILQARASHLRSIHILKAYIPFHLVGTLTDELSELASTPIDFPQFTELYIGPDTFFPQALFHALARPTITHLTVHYSTSRYEPATVLEVLKRMPMLQYCELRTNSASLDPVIATRSSLDDVELPHLTSLSLLEEAWQGLSLLDHLIFPSSTQVKIKLTNFAGHIEMPSLRQILRRIRLLLFPSDAPLDTLEIMADGQDRHSACHRIDLLTLKCWDQTSPRHAYDDDTPSISPARLHIEVESGIFQPESVSLQHRSIEAAFLSELPLRGALSVRLICPTRDIEEHLHRLDSVESLTFCGDGRAFTDLFLTLVPSATHFSHAAESSDSSHCLLPRLRRLELHAVQDLSCCYPDDWSSFWNNLGKLLLMRRKYARAIGELSFRGFSRYLPAIDVAVFRQNVALVRVDDW